MSVVDLKTQAWIKTEEGLRLQSYIDTTGNLTIGWGRNLRNGISIDEAELMFQNDLKRTMNELLEYSWFTNQAPNIQEALINMNFNLGITKLLEFKEMIAALAAKNYTLAAQAALDSLWAKQLPDRAKSIALMLRQST